MGLSNLNILVLVAFMASFGTYSQSKADPTPPLQYFDYRLGTIPLSSTSCADVASGVGQRFEAETGLKVGRSECTGQTEQGYEVTVSYLARIQMERQKDLPRLFLAYNFSPYADVTVGTDHTSPDTDGIYSNFNDCAADAPVQASLYRAKTGIEPVATYCVRALMGGFSLHIDAFGTPQIAPSHFAQSLVGYTYGDTGLVQALTQALEAQGATVARGGVMGNWFTLIYYVKGDLSPLRAATVGSGSLNTPQDCRAQLADGTAAFTALGIPPLVTRCLPDGMGGAGMNFFFLGDAPAGVFERSGPVYADYSGCVSDRPHVAQTYQAASGEQVATVLCTKKLNDTTFQASILTHN